MGRVVLPSGAVIGDNLSELDRSRCVVVALNPDGTRSAVRIDEARRAIARESVGVLLEAVPWEREDAAALQALADGVVNEVVPSGPIECELTAKVIVALWRARRMEKIEAATLTLADEGSTTVRGLRQLAMDLRRAAAGWSEALKDAGKALGALQRLQRERFASERTLAGELYV